MGPTAAVAAVRCAVRQTLAPLAPRQTLAPLAPRQTLAPLAPRQTLAPLAEDGALVLVACSGGADSLALAAGAAFEGPRLGLRVGAVTVDHGLQPGSAARAATVRTQLRELGLDPVEVVAVEVTGAGGPEAAARTARYAALDSVAQRLGAVTVLLGHTLDDQAETVLLGLARGSGTRSLAGMPAVAGAGGRYRRPLLALERAVTRAACADLRLAVWDDPHNADREFTRVRVRADVLPLLEAALGPGVAAALARTAELARDDADALDGWASTAKAALTADDGALDAAAVAALPPAVRRRVLRLAALEAGSTAGALGSVHLAALDALVVDWHGQGAVSLPGGRSALRRYGRLYLGKDLQQ